MSLECTSDDRFEADVLQSTVPVLAVFSAAWCGPCRAIAPLLEQVAQERDDIKIYKIDVDESRDTAVKHNVRGVPTLLLFKAGEVAAQHVGALTRTQLDELVNQHMDEE